MTSKMKSMTSSYWKDSGKSENEIWFNYSNDCVIIISASVSLLLSKSSVQSLCYYSSLWLIQFDSFIQFNGTSSARTSTTGGAHLARVRFSSLKQKVFRFSPSAARKEKSEGVKKKDIDRNKNPHLIVVIEQWQAQNTNLPAIQHGGRGLRRMKWSSTSRGFHD